MRDPLEKAEITARDLGRRIKSAMPVGWGFTLVLYNYGGNGAITYLSSGQREDCIKMLEELLTKIKTNEGNI